MGLAPFFGELAFDGGFEDGGFVAFEVGLDALEVGDGFVEAVGEAISDREREAATGPGIDLMDVQEAAPYACEDADVTWRLKAELEPKLTPGAPLPVVYAGNVDARETVRE